MKIRTREQLIEKIKAGIEMPRLQISVILAVTAFIGFISSVILLWSGITSMTIRYPLAVLSAYIGFLILLRIWLWWQSDERVGPVDLDGVIIGDLIPGEIAVGGSMPGPTFGGGGEFAGGGAGGSWSENEVPVPLPAVLTSKGHAGNVSPVSLSSSSSSGSSGGGSDLSIDLDDGIALVVVLVVIAIILSALIYVVWIAPVLLAELMVDAALAGGLYGTIVKIERRHWLHTALRKTGIPALVVVIMAAIAGLVIEAANPDAVTIGQFLSAFE